MRTTRWFAILALTTTCGGALPSMAAPPAPSTATPQPTSSLFRTVAPPANAPIGTQWISVGTFDGRTLFAAVQLPPGNTPAPVLIVLHGDGGLRQMHLDLAASLTHSGFITVAPCWQGYADPKDNGPVGCAADAPQRDSASAVAKDVGNLAAAARTLPRATRSVGVIGHSAGGTAAILAASLAAPVDAAASLSGAYGSGQIKVRWGTSAPEQVASLGAPLLIVHGLNDTQANGTRPDLAKAYEKSARDAGKSVEAIYIEGAPHDFPFQGQFWTDELRAKVAAFLKRHLSG